MVRIVAVLLLGCVVGCGQASAGKGGFASGTPQQEAVRAWLRENTNDGEWEEVRWWGPVNPFANHPGEYMRLKYRAKNFAGASVLEDDVFRIRDNTVSRQDRDMKIVIFRQRYFEGDKTQDPNGLARIAESIKNGSKPKKPKP